MTMEIPPVFTTMVTMEFSRLGRLAEAPVPGASPAVTGLGSQEQPIQLLFGQICGFSYQGGTPKCLVKILWKILLG